MRIAVLRAYLIEQALMKQGIPARLEHLDEILRMIDAPGIDRVAIGTLMDANDEPVLRPYREFPPLEAGLRGPGLCDAETQAVMGGSFARLFSDCRGSRARPERE